MKFTKLEIFKCIWLGLSVFAAVCFLLTLAPEVMAVEPKQKPLHCEADVRKMARICAGNINTIYNSIIANCSKPGGEVLDFELPDGTQIKIYCSKVQEI